MRSKHRAEAGEGTGGTEALCVLPASTRGEGSHFLGDCVSARSSPKLSSGCIGIDLSLTPWAQCSSSVPFVSFVSSVRCAV